MLNVLGHHPLFLVPHVRGDHVIDPPDVQLAGGVIFGGICGVIVVDLLLDLPDGLDIFLRYISVDSIGQAAHQQVFAKKVQHFGVGRLV